MQLRRSARLEVFDAALRRSKMTNSENNTEAGFDLNRPPMESESLSAHFGSLPGDSSSRNAEPGPRLGDFAKTLFEELKTATDNHFDAARECLAISTTLGWLAPLLAAASGATFLQGFPQTAALAAFASSIVGALKQAYGSEYEKRAKEHRGVGGQFAALRTRAELQIVELDQAELKKITTEQSAILKDKELPPIPGRIFHLKWPARFATYVVIGIILVALITLATWRTLALPHP
jgi:hypothetical protein